MRKLILLTDFTEAFAHKLLKGITSFSVPQNPWMVCRMPPSYKREHGLDGVLDWAKKWKADAIVGRFDPEDRISCIKSASGTW